MKVENVEIIGLESSIKASKYPMAIDTSKCDSKITPTVKKEENKEKTEKIIYMKQKI